MSPNSFVSFPRSYDRDCLGLYFRCATPFQNHGVHITSQIHNIVSQIWDKRNIGFK